MARGKTTSWQNNFSTIKVKSYVLGTDGLRYKRAHSHFSEKITPEKTTVKYLRHRWTHLGEKSPPSISGTDGPICVKKSSQNILGTDGPTWVKTDKQEKKNKSNTNIYKQKQTVEETGKKSELAK